MRFRVNLNLVSAVADFVRKAIDVKADIDVSKEGQKYIVDGKSIMGLMSLDLSQPVIVEIDDVNEAQKFMDEVAQYVIH